MPVRQFAGRGRSPGARTFAPLPRKWQRTGPRGPLDCERRVAGAGRSTGPVDEDVRIVGSARRVAVDGCARGCGLAGITRPATRAEQPCRRPPAVEENRNCLMAG